MKTLIFEDDGQDSLEWDIDESGKVVDCRPFQGFAWIGTKVREVCIGRYPRVTLLSPVNGTRNAILYHRVAAIKEAA